MAWELLNNARSLQTQCSAEAQGQLLQLVLLGAGRAAGASVCAWPLAFPFPQAAGAASLAMQSFPACCTLSCHTLNFLCSLPIGAS